MDQEQAMQEYISCVNILDPEGSTKVIPENLFLIHILLLNRCRGGLMLWLL